MTGTMKWFGRAPFGPVCEPEARRPVPLGEPCAWCTEAFEADDAGVLVPHLEFSGAVYKPWHRECWLRSMSGSVAHQQQRCSCYGGTDDHDESPGMTKREEAALAVKLWTELSHLPKVPCKP